MVKIEYGRATVGLDVIEDPVRCGYGKCSRFVWNGAGEFSACVEVVEDLIEDVEVCWR